MRYYCRYFNLVLDGLRGLDDEFYKMISRSQGRTEDEKTCELFLPEQRACDPKIESRLEQ